MTPPGPQHAADFDMGHVEAARSVIIEIWQVLAAFRDAMVVVGGWVPDLLHEGAEPPHTGSIDVDLLLDPAKLQGAQYARLLELLVERGYIKTGEPFRFVKEFKGAGGEQVRVDVEFLVPRGSLRRKRGRLVPGFRAIEADGARLAVRSTVSLEIDGIMPSGARNTVQVRVPTPAAFLVMKAYALAGRYKEKDAYDIVFCLRHALGGVRSVAEELLPHRHEAEVGRALEILAEKFASPESFSPQAVADFLDPADPSERAFLARDAYERIQALLAVASEEQRGEV